MVLRRIFAADNFPEEVPELNPTADTTHTRMSAKAIRHTPAYLVCAVGRARVRKIIVEKVKAKNPDSKFAVLIDPSVEKSDFVEIGEGTIICAHTILTVNIKIGRNVIMNLNGTVGHDAVIGDYVTMYPDANVSGITTVGDCTELGTGMQVIQGVKIGSGSIIGAGAVVIRDIPDKCTAVGNPAKPIKFFD